MKNKIKEIKLESSIKLSDDIADAISNYSKVNEEVEFFRILEKSTNIFLGFIFYFFMANGRTFEEFKNAIYSSVETFRGKENDN